MTPILGWPTASAEDPTSAGCGLVAAYGAVFEAASGAEIEANEETRPEHLLGLSSCVEGLIEGPVLERYLQLSKMIDGPLATRDDRAERAVVLVELAAAISNSDVVLQRRQVARRLIEGWRTVEQIIESQRARPALDLSGWLPASKSAPHGHAGTYQQQCESAGVPVPGALNVDSRWSAPTALDSETSRYLFRSNWRSASVWTYRADDGGYCVALLRRNPDESLAPVYFGAICTDSEEVDTCFFDSIVYEDTGGTRRIGPDEFRDTDFRDFVHPLDGQDRCNSCHLGKNPFVVNPATVLGQTIMPMYSGGTSANRFRFTGLDTTAERWTNFGPMSAPSSMGCMGCHEVPAVTKQHSFCAGILERAANTMMPPGHWENIGATHPQFWPDPDGCFDPSHAGLSSYFSSMVRIKAHCSGASQKMCSK